jgi:hypothetical protein
MPTLNDTVKLRDEFQLMLHLMEATFHQIKMVRSMAPIKTLIEIYDMLHLTIGILDDFDGKITFDSLWVDRSNLKALNKLRCELVVYHRDEFEFYKEFDAYIRTFQQFLFLVELRLKNMEED